MLAFIGVDMPGMNMEGVTVGSQPQPAPQDIEVVYSRAPEGVSQELWDWLTEEDARDEAAKQNKQIAPRLDTYRKLVDGLLN